MLLKHHISEKKIISNRQGNAPEKPSQEQQFFGHDLFLPRVSKIPSFLSLALFGWGIGVRVRSQIYKSCNHEHRCFGFHFQLSELCIFQHLWLPKDGRDRLKKSPVYIQDTWTINYAMLPHYWSTGHHFSTHWTYFPLLSCMICFQFLDWHRAVVMAAQQTGCSSCRRSKEMWRMQLNYGHH